MISVNLLPPQLRKKRTQGFALGQMLNIPREVILGLFGGFIVLLILCDILLQLFIFVKFSKHTDYKKKYYHKKLLKNNKEALQVLTAIERVRKGIDLRENEKVERDTHETEYTNDETTDK